MARRPFTERLSLERGSTADFPPTPQGIEAWDAKVDEIKAKHKAELLASLQPALQSTHSQYAYGENLERDEWLYHNREKMTLAELEAKLEQIATRRKWTPISMGGIRHAMSGYCAYFGKPIPSGKVGRPRKS